jgi:hypothetical protein
VEYTGAADATFDGLFSLSADPATPTDATFRSVGAGSGGLTLSGFASGSGNLVVENTGGSTSAFTLALTGSFDGTTTVNDADVTINTQGSVGQDGLTLNTTTVMDATIGAPLAFGSAQLLTIGGTVNMSGGTANAAINAQGGLHSAAAATLNLDDIDLTVGDGTASTFTGDISLTDGASLTLDGADLGAVDLASIAGGAEVTFGGVGTIGSIGDLAAFSGRLNLGDLGASASSVLNVTGNASLAAASILRSHFLSTSGGTGTADQLAVGGAFTAGSSTASLVFDPTVFDPSGGTWIPTPGDTDTYTVVTATGGFNGTFGTVNVVTIDPITGLPTTRTLDQSGETRFLGAGFSVDYTGTAFSVSILGIGGPDPLPVPGTTNTNVIVPVDVGGTIVNRNANVGVVQNQQINQSAAAMNVLAQTATGDTEFVATQLLLQSGPAAYASSVVAVSAPTNPYALPTTLMLGMSEAGDLAMERLMQLRPQMTAPQAPPRQRGTGGPRSTAVAQSVASTRRKAFGAELNGPTPDEGMRGWARGFGFTGSFSNQNWAQTSYDSTLGNVAAGVDTVLGDGRPGRRVDDAQRRRLRHVRQLGAQPRGLVPLWRGDGRLHHGRPHAQYLRPWRGAGGDVEQQRVVRVVHGRDRIQPAGRRRLVPLALRARGLQLLQPGLLHRVRRRQHEPLGRQPVGVGPAALGGSALHGRHPVRALGDHALRRRRLHGVRAGR